MNKYKLSKTKRELGYETTMTKPWSFLNDSSIKSFGLENSLQLSELGIQNQLVFNSSGTKFYTNSMCSLYSFDAYNLKVTSQYQSRHNKDRVLSGEHVALVADVAANQFHDDVLSYSLCPELVIFNTQRNEATTKIDCGITQWNRNRDCLIQASQHSPNIVYFTTKKGKTRSVKSIDLLTNKINLLFSFQTEFYDSIFLNNPSDKSKFVIVENYKLLFFDTLGTSKKDNLKPYMEFDSEKLKITSRHNRISCLKFNANGSELLVSMSHSFLFVLDINSFIPSVIRDSKIYKAEFLKDNKNYIFGCTNENHVVIYSRESNKVIKKMAQQNSPYSYALSPTDCLLAVTTVSGYGRDLFPIINTFSPLGNCNT